MNMYQIFRFQEDAASDVCDFASEKAGNVQGCAKTESTNKSN